MMNASFRGRLKIISPSFWVGFFVLANLFFCTGCENKQAIKIGDTPPIISGNDIHGKNITKSKQNAKLVVIYFWTNSCCGDSLKKLEPLYSENKEKGLTVLAVNEGDTKEFIESYAKNNALTFTLIADKKSNIYKQYQVVGFPTIFIIDKNWILREKILGNIPIEKLEKLVEKQFKIQKAMEADYEKIHSR